MAHRRGELVPIAEALADLPGPVQAIIPSATFTSHCTTRSAKPEPVRKRPKPLRARSRRESILSPSKISPNSRCLFTGNSGSWALALLR